MEPTTVFMPEEASPNPELLPVDLSLFKWPPVKWPLPDPFDQTIIGTRDDDELAGDRGKDRIDGLAGNDILKGKGGNDSLIGGEGNDTLEGGSGNDTLYGDFSNRFFFYPHIATTPDLTINHDAVNDDLIIAPFPLPFPFPPVPTNPGNNVLDGGKGNDMIFGGAGDDHLIGDEGNDVLDGGSVSAGFCTLIYDPYGFNNGCLSLSGDDHLEGGSGDDTLRGNAGNDSLKGGHGHDVLNGGLGSDVLLGGDGDDVLTGGQGDDILEGGQGSDYFQFSIRFPFQLILFEPWPVTTDPVTVNSLSYPTPEPQLVLPPLPEPGIDEIKDFSAQQGDKIEILSNGSLSLEQFDYDQMTGSLSFEDRQFVQLQAGLDFDLSRDLILPTPKHVPLTSIA